jgi:hypothetical protein
LLEHGLDAAQAENVTAALSANPQRWWVKFMMRFDPGLEEPAASRTLRSP